MKKFFISIFVFIFVASSYEIVSFGATNVKIKTARFPEISGIIFTVAPVGFSGFSGFIQQSGNVSQVHIRKPDKIRFRLHAPALQIAVEVLIIADLAGCYRHPVAPQLIPQLSGKKVSAKEFELNKSSGWFTPIATAIKGFEARGTNFLSNSCYLKNMITQDSRVDEGKEGVI